MPTFDIAIFSQENAEADPLLGFIDAYLSEDHTITMDITSHPVESGSSIVDNAVKKPDRFKCKAVLSDGLPSIEADNFNALTRRRRVPELWSILRGFMENRTRLMIVTRPLYL